MASSRIKGIDIVISGNTQKLQDALKGVDKQIYGLNADLKDLNKALKLDPNNTELLAQKQDVLARNIKTATDRLNALKEAQKKMGEYSKLTDEQKSQYNALSGEIAKTENALKSLSNEQQDTYGKLNGNLEEAEENTKDLNEALTKTSKINMESLKTGLSKVGEVALDVGKQLAKITTAVAGALSGVVGYGVKSYADLEQNIGGIEKLFGKSADELIEKSKSAYKTAGLSANQYMETATSFSASLLKGLNGDTEKATSLTDRAIRDMSDNANTFGTSMEEVSNVYKALSKEQYSTLDNLRLGYSGTKEGMKQLIKDASSYKDIQKELGITVDESSMSFDNIINALSVVQKKLKIAGTTSKEASGTISGSINSMKASFDNFINGTGGANDLIESVNNVLTNVSNAVLKIAPSILSGIPTLITSILPQIITMITSLLPQLLSAITSMINQLYEQLTENKESLANTITTLINQAVSFITENLPTILEMGIVLLQSLIEGIISSLPNLIDSALVLLDTICNTIIDNIDDIIDLALTLIINLTTGLIDALPKLIQKVPIIITKLVEALTKPEMIIKLVGAALTLMVELGKGLIECIPQLIAVVPTLIKNLVESFKKTIKETDWGKLGSDIIKGILDGFGRIGNYITTKVNEVKDTITNKFKKAFGIASPSKLFKKVIGSNLALGVSEGFTEEMKRVSTDMTKSIPVNELIGEYDTAMRSLTRGINSSVNPTINPSITYEQNYSLMSKAMKEALNDMVVDLDDREVGRFVSKTITNEVYGR